MLPKQPPADRDEPDLSPALARRRDHMLGADPGRREEPRLVSSQSEPLDESEIEPEIPPIPPETRSSAVRSTAAGTARPRIRLRYVAAAAVALLLVGGVSWFAFDRGTDSPAIDELPYVTAEAGPEKVRPESEGGLDVPNQDIRVYNELGGGTAPAQPEVLLPPPENPVAPPTPSVAESVTAESPPAPAADDIPMVPAPELTMEPAAGGGTDSASTEEPAPAAAEPAAAEPAPTQTAATTGAFRIQLAAVKSSDAAKAAWRKLSRSHPDVLGGLKLNVAKVERADGTLYRIQGGMFADRAAAEAACGKLKQKNQDCLVVAP